MRYINMIHTHSLKWCLLTFCHRNLFIFWSKLNCETRLCTHSESVTFWYARNLMLPLFPFYYAWYLWADGTRLNRWNRKEANFSRFKFVYSRILWSTCSARDDFNRIKKSNQCQVRSKRTTIFHIKKMRQNEEAKESVKNHRLICKYVKRTKFTYSRRCISEIEKLHIQHEIDTIRNSCI